METLPKPPTRLPEVLLCEYLVGLLVGAGVAQRLLGISRVDAGLQESTTKGSRASEEGPRSW